MKIWISKYALSTGITEHEADIRDGYAHPGAPFMAFTAFKIGTDAHESLDLAVAAAERARTKKIASLKAQIAKLERMKF